MCEKIITQKCFDWFWLIDFDLFDLVPIDFTKTDTHEKQKKLQTIVGNKGA